jgi:hypothetical protein
MLFIAKVLSSKEDFSRDVVLTFPYGIQYFWRDIETCRRMSFSKREKTKGGSEHVRIGKRFML